MASEAQLGDAAVGNVIDLVDVLLQEPARSDAEVISTRSCPRRFT